MSYYGRSWVGVDKEKVLRDSGLEMLKKRLFRRNVACRNACRAMVDDGRGAGWTGGRKKRFCHTARVLYFCNFIYSMVNYTKHILHNGLTVLTHEAADTPLATVNVLYNVGARDEDPGRTGFAHLFEHLMFSGTPQVPDFDAAVSAMSGECNAFTNNDYTNYYMTVPSQYLQDALRLEADRMKNLKVSAKALEVQQRVVTEEYKQRYVNQPYGDVWLLLRPLCYRVHPYQACERGGTGRCGGLSPAPLPAGECRACCGVAAGPRRDVAHGGGGIRLGGRPGSGGR